MSGTCSKCEYAEMENGKVTWCRFHRQKINPNNYCDHFLDLWDSPYFNGLLEKKYKGKKASLSGSYIVRDVLAWILIAIIILASIAVFLYF